MHLLLYYFEYSQFKNAINFVFDRFSTRRVMLLEFSQYLENYLWPNYSTEVRDAVISILTQFCKFFI